MSVHPHSEMLEPASEAAGILPRSLKSRKRQASKWLKRFAYVFTTVLFLFSGGCFWFFFTESGSHLRYLMADTIISTQHRDWAKYLIGQEALDKRVNEYWDRFDEMAAQESTVPITVQHPPATAGNGSGTSVYEEPKELVTVEEVDGDGFKGYILYVHDPLSLRVMVPEKAGKGEKVSSMVQRTGALAGVNGGAFADPNGKGNGFRPSGVVISDSQILYNGSGSDQPTHIVGIDKDGVMVAGKFRPSEMQRMGIKEAVTFAPKFIVDGKGLIRNDGEGWGIAPRTCMAQKQDGTIMFVIIDGRQPTYSIGASLYDVQQLLLERGAVIAANLDGGSSTVLVKDNEIVNRPASRYGERYLPTAFLVYERPEQVFVNNVWKGLRPEQIDASKW